jgi:hypothetical protein
VPRAIRAKLRGNRRREASTRGDTLCTWVGNAGMLIGERHASRAGGDPGRLELGEAALSGQAPRSIAR